VRIAIIPARFNSQRIPGKNTRDFRGKPIICYAINAAQKSGLFDSVVVSTDGAAVAAIASTAGAEVVWRDYDDGTKGTQEVARDVLVRSPEVTEACVIYPCSPLLVPSDLTRAHAVLQRLGALYAMSVQTSPLADAGCFYMGKADAFRNRAPLIDSHTVMVPMPAGRCIDINTEADWAKAELMYDNHFRRIPCHPQS
jgi:pseudaminic acid cytidylyltransferase